MFQHASVGVCTRMPHEKKDEGGKWAGGRDGGREEGGRSRRKKDERDLLVYTCVHVHVLQTNNRLMIILHFM